MDRQCPLCDQRFASSKERTNHVSSVHWQQSWEKIKQESDAKTKEIKRNKEKNKDPLFM